MRIAIDLDGVIADFIWSFSAVAAELGLIPERYRTSVQQSWTLPFNHNPVWKIVKSRWNWWMTLEPIATHVEIAAMNKAIGEHDVYFITSRPRGRGLSAELQARYWLAGIGVDVDGASVIATKTGTKGALCQALDIEAMLEDCPDNLEDLWRHGISTYARRQPYNADWKGSSVGSITEFLEELS